MILKLAQYLSTFSVKISWILLLFLFDSYTSGYFERLLGGFFDMTQTCRWFPTLVLRLQNLDIEKSFLTLVIYFFFWRYYYHNFPTLGKRPPQPELPKRGAYQPRVSCDEYEQGSCRWYDEWNYDHIVDYTANLRNLIWICSLNKMNFFDMARMRLIIKISPSVKISH